MDDLDQLEGVIQQNDEAAASNMPPDPNAPPAPVPTDYGQEATQVVELFAALVVGYAPKAESLWSVPTQHRVAATLAPVMEKYGWTLGTLPPEIGLAITAGPVLWATAKVMTAQAREERAQALAQAQAQGRAEPDGIAAAVHKDAQASSGPELAVHPQVKLYQQ